MKYRKILILLNRSDNLKTKAEYNKLRGGYYTSSQIAEFITNWAINSTDVRILEPSCGDGSFIKHTARRFKELGAKDEDIKNNILGIELDEDEVNKAKIYGPKIINSDFFTYYKEKIYMKEKFDVIVGNPPFIRYQNFNNDFRKIAFDIMEELKFKPTKLTNIWIPFLVLSAYALSDNGRVGMVIPAELFQVDYAAETRGFLSRYFERLTIVTFKELLFDDAQQEVILLLGEKKSTKKGIQVIELGSSEELKNLNVDDMNEYEIKELDHDNEKWIKYYLSNDEISFIRQLKNNNKLVKTTELFDVNVGIVSGQNKFFIIDKNIVNKYDIKRHVRHVIGRAEHVKGIVFDKKSLKELDCKNKKIYMFTPENLEYDKLSDEEKKYIKFGELNKYNVGYKCRIRKLWYIVPQTWEPEAFMLRQIHTYPKMILNETDASTTDTLYKVRFKQGVNGTRVVCAFINSLTFALGEITGRSYGGGVLTFEPGEIRKLLIPMEGSENLNINDIDMALKNGNVEEALDMNDKILLKEKLGLNESEILMLRTIWERLRDRRVNRKKRTKKVENK